MTQVISGTYTTDFVYDANGARIIKSVTDSSPKGGPITTRTLYIGGIYEERITNQPSPPYISYYTFGGKLVCKSYDRGQTTGIGMVEKNATSLRQPATRQCLKRPILQLSIDLYSGGPLRAWKTADESSKTDPIIKVPYLATWLGFWCSACLLVGCAQPATEEQTLGLQQDALNRRAGMAEAGDFIRQQRS